MFFQPFHGVAIDAAVDGHKRHAVGALAFDQIEEQFFIQTVGVAVSGRGFAEGLVEGHIAHRQVHRRNDLAADQIQIAAHGKFHEGVGTGRLGSQGFTHFGIDIGNVCGGTDGGVDFGGQPPADPHDTRGVGVVDGDDDLAFGHALPDQFHRHALGHGFHLEGDLPGQGGFYMRLMHRFLSPFVLPAGHKKPRPVIAAWGFAISAWSYSKNLRQVF